MNAVTKERSNSNSSYIVIKHDEEVPCVMCWMCYCQLLMHSYICYECNSIHIVCVFYGVVVVMISSFVVS